MVELVPVVVLRVADVGIEEIEIGEEGDGCDADREALFGPLRDVIAEARTPDLSTEPITPPRASRPDVS